MKFFKTGIIILIISAFTLSSACKTDYHFKLVAPKKIRVNKPLVFHIKEKNGKIPGDMHFYLDGKEVASGVDISSYPLGKHTLKAEHKSSEKIYKVTKTIEFLAAKAYDIYDFEIIHTYPHDAHAYTQGLEFHDGYLYESTGRKGQSQLRKLEISTGKVLQKIDVPDSYFAEGMTIVRDSIYQLTWQSGKGFIYDKKTFRKIGEFTYGQSLEGWGLTHDDRVIYKSDGTEKIWRLAPGSMKELGSISCYTNKQAVKEINELEYINGKIYANVWMKNVIIIINPRTGAVEGVADMHALTEEMTGEQSLQRDDVLNGIAYDSGGDRLFVTGKNWSKLFEIKLKKRKK